MELALFGSREILLSVSLLLIVVHVLPRKVANEGEAQ